MSWDDAVLELKNRLPKFNDYLLRGFRKEQANRCAEFMDVVYREASQLFNGTLKYLGYRTLSPEKKVAYSIGNTRAKGRVNIQQSELELVEYMFEFEGKQFPVYTYLPYLKDGALIVNDTHFYIQLAIIEKMVFRVTDGVIIKVMRSPLQFWRTEQFVYTDTEGNNYYDAIITMKAHYRKGRSSSKPAKTPLVLYLLARYEFDHLVTKIMGLPAGSVRFVDTVKENDQEFAYFKCRDGVFLKVEKESILPDIHNRRFIASLLYIIKMSKRYTISDVYDMTFYKMLLGKNLYGASTKEALAAGHAESHLDSLKTYLDQYTKKELEILKIYCEDIFDLFVNVFYQIDNWLVTYAPNDLFAKRLGGIDLILMHMVKNVFTRFYDTLKKNKVINDKNISSMLKMEAMQISGMYKVNSLQQTCSLYNDNTLISTLGKKVRQSSTQENASRKSVNLITAKEHQFHPSFLAVESALSISSSSPGISGDINPYAQIDKMGYFQKDMMPWYDEIAPLQKYLIQV